MKYKSALMTHASGSLGGITASRNKSGNYFRARVTPTQPDTCRQNESRAIFSQLASSYADLSPIQRVMWEEYAENSPVTHTCGSVTPISGQNAFIRNNANRIRSGMPLRTDAPESYGMAPPPSTPEVFEVSEDPDELTVAGNFIQAVEFGGKIIWFIGRKQEDQRTSYHGDYQYVADIDVTASDTSWTQTLSPEEFQADPSRWPDEDHKTSTRFVFISDDGRVSPPVTCFEAPESST